MASSATLKLFAPGAFMTTMPRAVAAGDVDVVDAGAGASDNAELRRGVDQVPRHFRGASHDERVGVGRSATSSAGGRPWR